MRLLAALALLLAATPLLAAPCTGPAAVCPTAGRGALPLIAGGRAATVLVDPSDDPAVLRAAADLRGDLAAVAGGIATAPRLAVIVGTAGHSPLIDRLVAARRLDLRAVAGRWEGFVQQVVDRPAPGIDRALVIAGNDRRGAIYGAYDLSARIGISPWRWWADVPVRRAARLEVAPAQRADWPRVRYRGIFLNDEDPALKGWAEATYGGLNHRFYGRLFELVLRLKGNLVWPAMWGKAFYDDDPADKATAERYGVIVGTSHHEPLMRAHVEWARYGKGPWDYTRNADRLRSFWREGLARAAGGEHLVTIGMRGDGDEPMTQGTAIPLLERIVADQRHIIADVTGRPAAETPQVWALYKEVQDYYDQGMRVPDDVTLLFSDDNWGNLRRLPQPGTPRAGGYGIYYHFDYVGGPRNYKWINTSQVARTWDQLRLARAAGADRLWIANVGDLKPLELPTSFFLDYAWNPEAWPLARMPEYGRAWAAQQFGPAHAAAIADVLDRATRYAARRKFELLSPDSWSVTEDREAERVLADYARLEADARTVGAALPPADRDAYYELVLHQVEAAATLNRLYVTVALNRLHAAQGRADTNALADRAEVLFAADRAIARRYEASAGGKWPHMMDQTHIGYTSWQQPDRDVMPAVRRIALPAGAALGVAVEGSAEPATPGGSAPAPLVIERFGRPDRRIELFARGTSSFPVTARRDAGWLRVDRRATTVGPVGATLTLSVDWTHAPAGVSHAAVTIAGPGQVVVPVTVVNRPLPPRDAGFVEADGQVTIDAAHFASRTGDAAAGWQIVPQLGRWGSAVAATASDGQPRAPGTGPALTYRVTLAGDGEVLLTLFASPSLDVSGKHGLRYAVSVDGGAPQVVDLLAGDTEAKWDRAVIEAARTGTTRHRLAAGRHLVRLWMVDPGLSVQRLVLSRRPVATAALGAVESLRR